MKALSFIVFIVGNELFQEATFSFDPNPMLSLRQHLFLSLATTVLHSLGAFKNQKHIKPCLEKENCFVTVHQPHLEVWAARQFWVKVYLYNSNSAKTHLSQTYAKFWNRLHSSKSSILVLTWEIV